MKKYLKFFRRIFILSFLKIKSYAQDFFVAVVIVPCYMLADVGFVLFAMNAGNTSTVAGYTAGELIFLLFFSRFVTDIACFSTLTSGRLPYQILHGELDFFLIKPLPPFISIGIQQFFVDSLMSMGYLALGMVATAYLGDIHFTPITTLQSLFVLLQSALLFLVLAFSGGIVSFFFDGVHDVQDFIHESKNRISIYPAEIFPKIFQNILTFVLPVLLVASPMFKVLKGTYTASDFLLAMSVTIVFLFINILLWHFGIKRYQSSN